MLLGISSQTAITLNPFPDLRDPLIPIKKETSRGIDGSYQRANEPKIRRWEFTVDHVPVVDAFIVQSWWSSAASLYLWPDEILYPNSAYPVAITNPVEPLDRNTFPYYGIYRGGKLMIETRSAF